MPGSASMLWPTPCASLKIRGSAYVNPHALLLFVSSCLIWRRINTQVVSFIFSYCPSLFALRGERTFKWNPKGYPLQNKTPANLLIVFFSLSGHARDHGRQNQRCTQSPDESICQTITIRTIFHTFCPEPTQMKLQLILALDFYFNLFEDALRPRQTKTAKGVPLAKCFGFQWNPKRHPLQNAMNCNEILRGTPRKMYRISMDS
jgi:hypothetical protein